MAFQLWQESVARYTEYAIAEKAAGTYEPSEAFLALGDGSFAVAAAELRSMHEREMAALDPGLQKRTAFYPLGAALALALDRTSPGWRDRYLGRAMDLAPLFAAR